MFCTKQKYTGSCRKLPRPRGQLRGHWSKPALGVQSSSMLCKHFVRIWAGIEARAELFCPLGWILLSQTPPASRNLVFVVPQDRHPISPKQNRALSTFEPGAHRSEMLTCGLCRVFCLSNKNMYFGREGLPEHECG